MGTRILHYDANQENPFEYNLSGNNCQLRSNKIMPHLLAHEDTMGGSLPNLRQANKQERMMTREQQRPWLEPVPTHNSNPSNLTGGKSPP